MGQLRHVVCFVKLCRVDLVNLVGIHFPLLYTMSALLKGYAESRPLVPRHHRFVLAEALPLILPIPDRERRLSQYRVATRICSPRSHCRPRVHGSGLRPAVALQT